MEYQSAQQDSQGKVFGTILVFESVDKCPKCKEDRFMIKAAKKVRKFYYKYHEAPVNAGKCYHMDITCSFCGYEWAEGVADEN